MKSRKVYVLFLYLFILFLIYAQNNQHVAKIDLLLGNVNIYQNGGWIEAGLNQKLYVGDLVETKKDSYAEIIFKDENIKIEVEEKTKIEIKKFEKREKTIKSFFGKIWNRIKRVVGQKYKVETKYGSAGVRGTEFAVELIPEGGLDVICEKGEIYLKNNKGEEKIIKEGFKSGVTPGDDFKRTEKWDEKDLGIKRKRRENIKLLNNIFYYKKKVEYWTEKLSNGKKMDNVKMMESRISNFYVFYKLTEKKISTVIDNEIYKTHKNYKKFRFLMDELQNLYKKYQVIKKLITLEKRSIKILRSFRYKLYLFKNRFYNVLKEIGSFNTWISQAKLALKTGREIDLYKTQARKIYNILNNYRNLRRDYLNYKRLESELKRKKLFSKSSRLIKEQKRIDSLLKNFKIQQDNRFLVLPFERLQRIFSELIFFFNSRDGKELLE